MFRFPVDYEYVSVDSLELNEEVLQVGDRLRIEMNSNNNYGYIRSLTFNYNVRVEDYEAITSRNGFLIEKDSLVRLPVLGQRNLVGLTKRQAQDTLSKWYGEYVNDIVLELNITNRFVYVCSGLSNVREVNLTKEDMTLFELIAQLGGLGRNLKSNNIRIIRGGFEEPRIAEVNLSNFEQLANGNIVLQTGDYIVLQERLAVESIRPIVRDLSTIFSLITTTLSLYYIFR